MFTKVHLINKLSLSINNSQQLLISKNRKCTAELWRDVKSVRIVCNKFEEFHQKKHSKPMKQTLEMNICLDEVSGRSKVCGTSNY